MKHSDIVQLLGSAFHADLMTDADKYQLELIEMHSDLKTAFIEHKF